MKQSRDSVGLVRFEANFFPCKTIGSAKTLASFVTSKFYSTEVELL